MKLAVLGASLLFSIGSACLDCGERHGVAIELSSIQRLQPGVTNLAQASKVLGCEPCEVTPEASGGMRAAWWSYIGGDEAQSLRITEYFVVARFDKGQTLMSVAAADFRPKDFWYFPDYDRFMAEVAPLAEDYEGVRVKGHESESASKDGN